MKDLVGNVLKESGREEGSPNLKRGMVRVILHIDVSTLKDSLAFPLFSVQLILILSFFSFAPSDDVVRQLLC